MDESGVELFLVSSLLFKNHVFESRDPRGDFSRQFC